MTDADTDTGALPSGSTEVAFCVHERKCLELRKVEADRDVALARVKELEAERDRAWKTAAVEAQAGNDARERAEAAERENVELREALEVYADQTHWHGATLSLPQGYDCPGQIARAALSREPAAAEDGGCTNGPDERGNYPCDPLDNHDGTGTCQACGRIARWPVPGGVQTPEETP